MDKKDILRYMKIGEIIREIGCLSIGDFASGGETMKQFIDKDIKYKSYDYPEFNFEKSFILNKNVDCAISSEVLEHLRNPRVFLNSLANSMGKGSKLILTTPNSGFIKNRVSLLLGKTPLTFFGPSYKEAIFGKNYSLLSEGRKRELDFSLHVRAYNYKELKEILKIEGFKVVRRYKMKYLGIKGITLHLLPLNFQGIHFLVAELKN